MSSKPKDENLNKNKEQDEDLIKKRLIKVLQNANIKKSKAFNIEKTSQKQNLTKPTLKDKELSSSTHNYFQQLDKNVEKSETTKRTKSKKPNKNLVISDTKQKIIETSHKKEENDKITKVKNIDVSKAKSSAKHKLKVKKEKVGSIKKVASIESNSNRVMAAHKSKKIKKADVNFVKTECPKNFTEACANESFFTEKKKKITKRKSGDITNKAPPKKKKDTTIPKLPKNTKKKTLKKTLKKKNSDSNGPSFEPDNLKELNGLAFKDTAFTIDGSDDSDCSWQINSLDISNHITRTRPCVKKQKLSDPFNETDVCSGSLVPLTSNKLSSSPESVECDENTIDSYDSDLTHTTSENFVFSSDYEDDTYSPSYSNYSSSLNESNSDDDSDVDYFEDYNSSEDESYHLPEDEVEDVIIQKGNAIIYDFNYDMNIFDDDASSCQIVEIPSSEKSSNDGNDNNKHDESDDSCVKLIPIDENDVPHEYSSVENDYDDSDNSSDQVIEISSNDKSSNNGNDYDSDDSCIQLVPIEQNSDDEYLSDESESIKIVPHIFEVTSESVGNEKLLLKDILQNGTLESISSASTVDDEENPLTKLFKTSDNNTFKSEVITTKKAKLNDEPNYDKNITSIIEPEGEYVCYDKYLQQNPDVNISHLNDLTQARCLDKGPVNCSKKEQEQALPGHTEICTEEQFDTNNFSSKFYNAITSRHVLLLLKDVIYIYGTLKVRLIAGGAEVFGFNLERNNSYEIFSPRRYSLLYFKPVQQDTISKDLIKQGLLHFEADFLKQDLEEIVELFKENQDAILLLERNDRNKKVDIIKKYMKENLFPNMNSITLDRPFYASEFILRCLLYSDVNNFININKKWNSIHISSNSKIMIIGGKGVGKSTLGKYLINRNIAKFNKFLLIDLDIGQPELFIPQTISATLVDKPILGPGYFLDFTPEKSFLFGDINVVLSPVLYANCVKELINYCYSNPGFENIPWIINTMGYNKGFGNELISLIVHLLKPTEIIQIQSYIQTNNFNYIMTPADLKSIPINIFSDEMSKIEYDPQYRLTVLSSSVQSKFKTWDMMPKDTRLAMLLSHLGTIMGPKDEWLTDVKPVCAPIDKLDITNSGEDNLQKEDLLNVINGNLVYLCRKTAGIECYGIGIVRAIDYYQKKIFLLPAVESHHLANVNALVVCSIPLPNSIYTNQGPKIKDIVPYVYNTNDHVGSRPINQYYYRI